VFLFDFCTIRGIFRNTDTSIVDTSEDNIGTLFSIVSLTGPWLFCGAFTFHTLSMWVPAPLLGWSMFLRMHIFKPMLLLKKVFWHRYNHSRHGANILLVHPFVT
jgi:hypothetical protein